MPRGLIAYFFPTNRPRRALWKFHLYIYRERKKGSSSFNFRKIRESAEGGQRKLPHTHTSVIASVYGFIQIFLKSGNFQKRLSPPLHTERPPTTSFYPTSFNFSLSSVSRRRQFLTLALFRSSHILSDGSFRSLPPPRHDLRTSRSVSLMPDKKFLFKVTSRLA